MSNFNPKLHRHGWVKVWVKSIPVYEQTFWCICMIVGIVASLATAIALWQWGVVGGVIIGFALSLLVRG